MTTIKSSNEGVIANIEEVLDKNNLYTHSVHLLLAEVKRLQDENRGLQNTIAQMQDAEDKVYRCRLASGAKYTETLEIVKRDGVREGLKMAASTIIEHAKGDSVKTTWLEPYANRFAEVIRKKAGEII